MARCRVLMIDDEVGFAKLLKLNLEQLGTYEVRIEHRGETGLAAAQAFKPDIILLDVLMPDMDGGEVAAQLRTDPVLRQIPIVFLTAVVSREEADDKSGVIGGYPFIAKPVRLQQLVEVIEEQIGPHST